MRTFCTLVRPLLEFSSVTWSPYTITDHNRIHIQSVQRSFIKAIQNLRFSTNKQRLINLCVDGLQCRRIKADLAFFNKVLHNLVDVNSNELFTLSQNTHLT
jgi:hypothetical protein